jgi:hypothetical protein
VCRYRSGRQEENNVSAKEVMTDLVGESRPSVYERDGLTLGYSVVGEGQPILFVHGPEHWRELVTALHVDSLRRPDLSEEVRGGGRCPVLLVAGADDESTRRAQGRRFAVVSSVARYVGLEGAAHAVHRRCRDTFTQVIGAFLAEVDDERAGSHGATEDS